MRLAVTGTQGQVARALLERGRELGVEVICVGRPQVDFADPANVQSALEAIDADVIVDAAAYTAVDKAETEEALATLVNCDGAAAAAAAAAKRGRPFIQLSTDYVFSGSLERPYDEGDAVGPLSAYGRSKLAGEYAVAANCPRTTILRTAWVYSPFGNNFVKTMLRLGESREEVRVVADQRGSPTSAHDIADTIFTVARNLVDDPYNRELRGVFHMTGSGNTTWAEFAEEVFAAAVTHGRKPVRVHKIATADYPTPARRPANSRLSNVKLQRVFGVILPDWRTSTRSCVARLFSSL